MSRSQDIMENPCSRFLSWDSENGQFKYWDKTRGENGENVIIGLPLKILVLDTLSTIKGYSEKNKSGIWSNEVRKLDETKLIVRDAKGVIAEGLYKDIKDTVNANGGKFTVSVYGLDENGEFINLQLKGAAANAWIDFLKKSRKKIYTDAVVVASFKSEKKGVVRYTVPEFETEAISDEINEKAKDADIELQKYLKWYLNTPKTEPAEADNADY